MQINGIGNGNVHNTNMHQVTDCKHNHDVTKKNNNAGAAPSNSTTLQSEMNHYKQQEGQFSLSSWLKNALSGGKKILQKIWGGSADVTQITESNGENILQTEEQVMAQIGDPREGKSAIGGGVHLSAQEVAATAAVRQNSLENNPYFAAIDDTGRAKQSMWEKVRVRFHSLTGQLTKRFSNRNSFQTKQEQPKQDLRKHSRYREDDLEIDCILTDDSYLMDSYDRKGEYSKLSTKK